MWVGYVSGDMSVTLYWCIYVALSVIMVNIDTEAEKVAEVAEIQYNQRIMEKKKQKEISQVQDCGMDITICICTWLNGITMQPGNNFYCGLQSRQQFV